MSVLDAAALSSGQPCTAGVVKWGDGLVVAGLGPRTWLERLPGGRGFYKLDLDAGTAQLLVVPNGATALSIAGSDMPIVLCRSQVGVQLLCSENGTWKPCPVPPSLQSSPEELQLAASGDSVVVLGSHTVHLLDDGRWTSVDLAPPPLPSGIVNARVPDHLLLVGHELHLGYDVGEWGGAIVSLHAPTGSWSSPRTPAVGTSPCDPVTSLVVGPDGDAWATTRMAHRGIRTGAVVRVHDNAVVPVVTVQRMLAGRPCDPVALDAEGQPVDLPGDGFCGIAFDELGRPHVLSPVGGVFRGDGEGSWMSMTPGWPGRLYATGLALSGDRAVITTSGSGVVLWDLSSGNARVVQLEAPVRADGGASD